MIRQNQRAQHPVQHGHVDARQHHPAPQGAKDAQLRGSHQRGARQGIQHQPQGIADVQQQRPARQRQEVQHVGRRDLLPPHDPQPMPPQPQAQHRHHEGAHPRGPIGGHRPRLRKDRLELRHQPQLRALPVHITQQRPQQRGHLRRHQQLRDQLGQIGKQHHQQRHRQHRLQCFPALRAQLRVGFHLNRHPFSSRFAAPSPPGTVALIIA